MKLFGSYTSPYVRHCRIVLLETGIDCEFVETDTRSSATHSPTKRVPFLEHGELRLTDSSSIVRHLRELAGASFLPDVQAYDLFCLVNTTLDAAANLFLLEKDGITPSQSAYLARQKARIESCLQTLESSFEPQRWDDVSLRLVCFLDWTQFRRRLDLAPYPRLAGVLEDARAYPPFGATVPHEPLQ